MPTLFEQGHEHQNNNRTEIMFEHIRNWWCHEEVGHPTPSNNLLVQVRISKNEHLPILFHPSISTGRLTIMSNLVQIICNRPRCKLNSYQKWHLDSPDCPPDWPLDRDFGRSSIAA